MLLFSSSHRVPALPRSFASIIATGLKGGYQVVAADMNRDGKPDLIALASGMPDLVWYMRIRLGSATSSRVHFHE